MTISSFSTIMSQAAPSENSGIEIERGTSANKTFIWDESNDRWTLGSETLVAGHIYW